jgi:mannose-6-phosphate isomerase-like protein (cupin superfamily)
MPRARPERVTRLAANPLARVTAHGGRGRIGFRRLFDRAAFTAPVNFVDYAVVPPKGSIGLHRHGANEEIYLVLSGRGRMRLDAREFAVGPGSVVVNRPGGRHGLVNTGARDLRLFVVEVAAATAPRPSRSRR